MDLDLLFGKWQFVRQGGHPGSILTLHPDLTWHELCEDPVGTRTYISELHGVFQIQGNKLVMDSRTQIQEVVASNSERTTLWQREWEANCPITRLSVATLDSENLIVTGTVYVVDGQ